MEQKILKALKNVVEDIPMDDEKAVSLISDNSTNLIEAFTLDSFLRVQLIIELEEAFGIEIDMEEIDMEIYEECGKLKEMIQEYLNGDNV